MSAYGPVLSWAAVLSIAIAIWLASRPKNKQAVRDPIPEKVKAFAAAAAESDAPKKAKKKAKKAAAKVAAAVKPVTEKVESARSNSDEDDDLAEDIDPRDVARRMAAMKAGKLTPSQPQRSPFSTASHSGADADIDDEEPLSSSRDPTSDMLEAENTTAGVLRIGAPTQVPRQKKQKAASKEEAGIHAAKNQKKKEKKKAEAAAAREEQKRAFEKHRQEMRASEAAQAKTRPQQAAQTATAAAESAWTTVNQATKKAAAVVSDTTPVASTSGLLDTFAPSTDDEISASTAGLGESWESIPRHVQEPEPVWNEVKSKKGRGRKDASSDERDASEVVLNKKREATPPPAPVKELPRPQAPKEKPATGRKNGTSAQTSGSDWSQVHNLDAWQVHSEESDWA